MSTLTVATIKSNSSSPPAFQNTSGTQIGTLCRAWVNFDGSGVVAIRAQFNVSSITDNGVGDYTVNFTTAMPDANFATSGTSGAGVGDVTRIAAVMSAVSASVRIGTGVRDSASNVPLDALFMNVAIFR